MTVFRYPIEVVAPIDDIQEIEFDKSRFFILFKNGIKAVYVYNYIGGNLDKSRE